VTSQQLDRRPNPVCIPRRRDRRKHEQRPAFRRLVKWRTGGEGRISHLKHRYGWNRTRLTTLTGARIWCGHGVLAHNLTKITALAAARTP
jgi:IS5 family transposase